MDLTSDDILGKEAVDPEGDILGIVLKLHLDEKAKSIRGVTIDQGMWKPDLFVGIEYIEKFGIDAIFLNKIPYNKYKGMRVHSFEGDYIGKVESVHWNEKSIQRIEISIRNKKVRLPWKRPKVDIYLNDIQEIGFSIILKKSYTIPNL